MQPQPGDPNQDLVILTAPEAAAILAVSESQVYRWASAGRLVGFRIGAAWRFRLRDVEALRDARAGAEAAQRPPLAG